MNLPQTTLCRSTVAALLLLLILLAGCAAVGPDYVTPPTKAPAAWHSLVPTGLKVSATSPEELAHWWTVFNDPVLTGLVEQAAADNTDLRQARARLREARARWGMSHADRFPTLDGSVSARSSHISEESGSSITSERYSAGFDSRWELDLFGGKRRAEEAASADLEVSREDLHDVLVSLLAEVSRNYVEMRSYQARLVLTRKNIETREETTALVRQRQATGLAAQLEVEQAVTSLEQARAQIPTLETNLAGAANRLAVLLGKPPGVLTDYLGQSQAIPAAPDQVVVGVPAETLRQRPDVRRAERQLAAQTARIGVATAALYPDLSLSGSIGVEALSFGKLFNATGSTSVAAANLAWSLFDFGAIRKNIEVQNALQEQALGKFEGTILSALEEVENGLTAYVREQHRCHALAKAAAASSNAFVLADQQYATGLTDFFTVLDSQRTLLALEDQLTTSRATIATNLISLYKALGGGWTSLAATAPNDQQEPQHP